MSNKKINQLPAATTPLTGTELVPIYQSGVTSEVSVTDLVTAGYVTNQEIHTATAGQTVFVLTTMQYTPGANSLSVFVDGVNQYGAGAPYAYVETNSTTITFVSGLHVGASVKFTTAKFNSSAPSSGTVTSVGLAMPSQFTVSNSPVTINGVLTAAWNTQTANTFLAAPNGIAGTPTFRSIVAADVPTLNQNTTGTASNVTGVVAAANGGTGQSSYAIGDLLYASGATALSKLADVATGNALISGGVATAPSWGKIGLTTHITGTLDTGNGGTGLTSFTANCILYSTSTSALTTNSALTYNGTGLGVGVASASNIIDVAQNGNTTVKISATNFGTNSAGLTLENQGQRNWQMWIDRSTDTLRVGHNNRATTLTTLDASGNFGLGTTSPSTYGNFAILTSGSSVAAAVSSGTGQYNGGYLYLMTTGASANYGGTTLHHALGTGAGDLTNTYFSIQQVSTTKGFVNSIYTVNYKDQVHYWYNSGGETMRLSSSGLMIKATTAAALLTLDKTSSGTSSNKLAVYGYGSGVGYGIVFQPNTNTGATPCRFLNAAGTEVGNINTATGTSTAYVTTSDYRLKENVEPMQNALEIVAKLNPVTYTWKNTEQPGQGFIAHELQAVVPEAVIGEKDAVDEDGSPKYQGIDTSFLVATLTKAIQEQQNSIIELQEKLKAAGVAGFH